MDDGIKDKIIGWADHLCQDWIEPMINALSFVILMVAGFFLVYLIMATIGSMP